MSDISIETAINDAEKTLDETPAEKATETSEETKEAPKEEPKKQTVEEQEAEMALSLFRALKDPAKGKTVIELMAKEAGLLETPAEKKEAVKTIAEVIKEGLGEDYEFLADKLVPTIQQAIELSNKDIRETLEQNARERESARIDAAIAKVVGTYEVSDELQRDMLNLMDEIPIQANVDPAKYFERLLKVAAADKGVALKSKSTAEVIKRNRDNAAARLAASGGGKSETSAVPAPKAMDLDAAIKAAQEELAKGA